MLVFHFPDKCREIIKFIIYSEVFVGIHIIDVHIDHIQRNVILAVALRDLFKSSFVLYPQRLWAEAKRKFRRDIAVPDHAAELFYDIIRSIPVDNIQRKVRILAETFSVSIRV